MQSQTLKRLNTILIDQFLRNELLQRNFFLYGHSHIQNGYIPGVQSSRIRMNIIQSCIDTLVNKISKNEPRPVFLTDNGDWSNRKKAEKREKFVYGQFYKSDVYKKAPQVLLNCLTFGDGFFKVFSKENEICIEPVPTMEIIVDDRDGLYGKPKEMWQIRYVDKETLKSLFPEKSEEIENAKTENPPFYIQGALLENLVMVVEYWKLPTRKVSKNKYEGGEHKIEISGAILLEEDWNRDTFPFVKISFVRNLVGYWSKGVAEILTPYQLQINHTLKTISDSIRIMGSPKVLYEYQSKIVNSHFNNDIGAMIGYAGTPPQFITPPPVAQELFQYLNETINRAYGEVGLSQLTATSMKPAGLNSGRALREYNDIETERFATLAKSYEQMFVDLAELVLLEAKEISKKFGKYSVLSPDKKGCEIINFSDIDIDGDAYVIQCYPTSSLPKTPSGRLEYVQEMLAGGLITPEEGLQLLDFPDTSKITKLKTSELDDILATIDHMLETDEYLPPEPYQNLELGIQTMKKAYLRYKNEKCPEEKLDLLVRWINDAIMMADQIANEQAEDQPTSSEAMVPELDELQQTEDQALLEEQLAQEQEVINQQ